MDAKPRVMIIKKRPLPPPLFKHQKEAVETFKRWEAKPYHRVVGGLLAFKMGLGKTRTCLELIAQTRTPPGDIPADAWIKPSDGTKGWPTGPTLVVCNKSNIQIWVDDIHRFYPHTLRYFVLYSSKDCNPAQVTYESLQEYDVVITTYETARKFFQDAEPQCFVVTENNFMVEEANLFRKSDIPDGWKIVNIKKPDPSKCKRESVIYSHKWRRIISDESQKFVNTGSALYQAMVALVAHSYICLSGTPIVNYNTDLYSVFRFMGLVAERKDWGLWMYENLGLKNRILMKDYSDTDIVLPKVTIKNIFIKLNATEGRMYNEIIAKLRAAMHTFRMGGASFAAPLAMFTRLRQLCCCSHILFGLSLPVQKEIHKLEQVLGIIDRNEDLDFSFLQAPPDADPIADADDAPAAVDDPEYLTEQQLEDLTPQQIKAHIQTRIDKLKNPSFFNDETLNEYGRTIKTSGKVDKVLEIIRDHPTSKILVFSSFVSFLKVVRDQFTEPSFLLHGQTSTQERKDMINAFNRPDTERVFFSSFKCGGVGLNLTVADIVIICEPWWNPSTEEQAIARSHRVGQAKPVTVYNLIIHPSFEAHLLKVQERKKNTMQQYLGTGAQNAYSRLDNMNAKDIINYILRGEGYNVEKHVENLL